MNTTDEKFSDPFQCLHCGNTTPMRCRGHHSYVMRESPDQQLQLLHMFDLLVCPVCSKPTLRSYVWLEPDGSPEDVVFVRHYPEEPVVPQALPDNIKRAYLAAEKIKPIDPNAYGVLAGRMLELITVDQGSEKTDLGAALSDIHKANKIPADIYNIAKRLMALRHVGGHASLGSLTSDEIPILSELCNAILFHLYVIPSLTSKADSALNKIREFERKKKGRPSSTSRGRRRPRR